MIDLSFHSFKDNKNVLSINKNVAIRLVPVNSLLFQKLLGRKSIGFSSIFFRKTKVEPCIKAIIKYCKIFFH